MVWLHLQCLVSLSFLRHCSLPLVGPAGREGLIFWFLCLWSSRCVLCRLLPRELLQGFWYRQDRRDAFVVLRLSSLHSWGLLRVPSMEMHCLLVWLGMFARGFLVTSNGSIFLGPGSASREKGSTFTRCGLSTGFEVSCCGANYHGELLFTSPG